MDHQFIRFAFLVVASIPFVNSSSGDRSYTFQKCLKFCEERCSRVSDVKYQSRHPIPMRWLDWNCPDDCRYKCMWKTVKAYEMDHSNVPQFYGKWPFVRFFGIQEPASAIFSLFNGAAHLYMLIQFRKSIPSRTPMFYIWHLYALVSANAWFWAMVFHTRDKPSTEFMDYVCAVSLVFSSLLTLIIRVIGPMRRWLWGSASVPILLFFTYHVYYLGFVKFDYGYNMRVNISAGVLSGIGWIAWSQKVKGQQSYVWKATASILSLNALILLELGDFPPFWWTLDAHALWHLGTVPVIFMWYSFVIDDSRYILTSLQKKSDDPPYTKIS
ncbi:hypothetical protein CAPTEDRAFT_219496 [Capitella teleta]|uniref:Post-GPI attachment to proteins factor 3 n=1 Tax=Capitella teleta TaxID=283909 RepID=X2APN1_CAPTE|nr:hypothetical protein CAPTEDRAFT_219496 [Capitella teleta]|eukprot:ELU10150.1 hypothetical protein CAPTEDRAFT_219496 [Capitella teleta]